MELQQEKDYFRPFSTNFGPFLTIFRPPRLIVLWHFEASVGIITYCTQPSLPKKRKGPENSFIEDAAVLFGSDNDEDEEEEEEDEDNNE